MGSLRVGIAVLAGLIAVGSLIAAALAQGGRFSARLDLFTHFAPVYAAAAAASLVLALAAPRSMKLVLALIAVAGMAAAFSLMVPEVLGGRSEPMASAGSRGELKIVQFNAWGGHRDVSAAHRWLSAQDADIIVLQEAGKLRDLLIGAGYKASCMSCGAIVLTRAEPVRTFPPKELRTRYHYLSTSVLSDEAGEFTVVGVHRFWPTRFGKAASQTRDLVQLLERYPKNRMILAGDFNSTPWSFARRREDNGFGLIRRTRALFTWPAETVSHNRLPAPFPYLPIDHVYAGPGWATVKVERGPRLGSDHYPVVVTLAPVETAVP